MGIPPDRVDNIFTPFNKIMSKRHLNKEGVGLGLSISKNIATKLNGSLEVQSEVGKGSTFTLIMPVLNDIGVHNLQDQI